MRDNNLPKQDRVHILNTSFDNINTWISDTVIKNAQNPSDKLSIIIGDVGCGKSTFNKYINTVFFGTFQQNRIVSSRVEYRKLYNYVIKQVKPTKAAISVNNNKVQDIVNTYVYCVLLRDLFHFCWSDLSIIGYGDPASTFSERTESAWPEFDLEKKPSQDGFREYLSDRKLSPSLIDQIVNTTKAAVLEAKGVYKAHLSRQKPSRRNWFERLLGNPEKQQNFVHFIDYVALKGVCFFVNFDGLDFVQVSDFINYTSHRGVLNCIANWLITSNRTVRVSADSTGIQPYFQLTMRPNTYELFWSHYSQALFDITTSEKYVISPEFYDIIENARSAFLDDISAVFSRPAKKLRITDMIRDLQEAMRESLNIGRYSINSIFMNNNRHKINFTRSVIEEIVSRAIFECERKNYNGNVDIFAEHVVKEVDQLRGLRTYRLIELLLSSKTQRFVNFCRIDGPEIDLNLHNSDYDYLETVIKDRNIDSGFVGNIFNYHIPYHVSNEFEFFLEKYRIVKLLSEKTFACSTKDIKKYFKNNGWAFSEYIDFSIGILLREGFISGDSADAGVDGYRCTPLGKLVSGRLIFSMAYLENVYFGCFLPATIQRASKNVTRDEIKRHLWVAASIYHCWLMLRFIRTCEKSMDSGIFELIRLSVVQTIDKIISAPMADSRIATTALTYIREYQHSAGSFK